MVLGWVLRDSYISTDSSARSGVAAAASRTEDDPARTEGERRCPLVTKICSKIIQDQQLQQRVFLVVPMTTDGDIPCI